MSQKQAACARMSQYPGRTKEIKVWANGDPKCYVFNINPKEFRNWSVIMNHLTQTMLPTFGAIKTLVELKTRKMINDFEGLDPRRKYIGIGATCKSLRMPIGGYKTTEELNRQAQLDTKTSATSKGEKVNDSKKFLAKTEKMQYTVIYVTVNGSDGAPQKAVFKRDELKQYDLVRNYLANILKIEGIQNLYTTSGTMLTDATEFKHGSLYVAAPFGEHFQKMDYVGLFKEKYPFCKKNKYFKVVASRHSYIALKRKMSCERAKASKKIGTSSRHSVQSQIPPMYTFKSIARERDADIKNKQTIEREKHLPLYNQIKSKQSQFIRFTIRPAPRQPEMPKQFKNNNKIPKFIRKRLAEEKFKMTRRHTFSGPSSSVMKNYLPQSLSMPTDAQSRIMEVFKKLNLTSGVENILAGGEAADEKDSSDQNVMYQYLQSLGRIESIQNPEMDVYFKNLLEKIVKMVEKKSEHKSVNGNKQEKELEQEIPFEPTVEIFDSLHHSGAKISIEIKQMSDENLSNVQQIVSGNKLFNVKVTYQPSVEAVNLIKTVQDSKSKENQVQQQKASREAIIVNDKIKENKVSSKNSSHVSSDKIFTEIATPNGSIRISMGSNSNTSNRSFIPKERSSEYHSSKTDSSNSKDNMISDKGRVTDPICDILRNKESITNTYTINTSSKVRSRTSSTATNRILSASKTSNRAQGQMNDLSHQEIKADQQLSTELKPYINNQSSSARIFNLHKQSSHKNVTKEENEKTEDPITQNKYFNEQTNLTDSIINKLDTIRTQISDEGCEQSCRQEKHVEEDSDKYITNNKKQEDKDIKILFEQSICESTTQHLYRDSFEQTSISSSSGTQQLNLERAGDIYGSSMQQLEDKIGQIKTISGQSVRQLVVNKVKSSTHQVDGEKRTPSISGSRTQHISDEKSVMSGSSRQTLENNENIINYKSSTSEKVVKNNEKVSFDNMIASKSSNPQSAVKTQENSNIYSSSNLYGESLLNRAVSRSSTQQLSNQNEEETNISIPSMTAAKMFENRSFSKSSTQKVSAENGEETNISRTGILAAKSFLNRCISKVTTEQPFAKSVEQTSIAMSNIVADKDVTNIISGSSTQRLKDENIKQSTISGSILEDMDNQTVCQLSTEHMGVTYRNSMNISSSNVPENVENRTTRSSTQRLSVKSQEQLNNLIIAEDKDNKTIIKSNIRLLAEKTVEQTTISRSSMLVAESVETISNSIGKGQLNISRSSILNRKNVEQQIASRSSVLDAINVEIEKDSRSSIPKSEEQTNICDSNLLATENVENSRFSRSSIQQTNARSGERTNISRSSILARNINENSMVSESSTRQLIAKNGKQSNVSGTSISIAETTPRLNTQKLDANNGEETSISRSSMLASECMKNAHISGISIRQPAANNRDQTNVSISSIINETNDNRSTISGLTLRQLAPKIGEPAYFSRTSTLTSDSVENGTNSIQTNTFMVNTLPAENIENKTISGSSIRQLSQKRLEQTNISNPSIVAAENVDIMTQQLYDENMENISIGNKYTLCENIVYQLISGSGIVSAENVQNRRLSGSSTQELTAKQDEQSTDISGINTLAEDVVKSNEITKASIRELVAKNGDELNVSVSNILAEKKSENNTISGISIRNLVPRGGEQSYCSKSSILSNKSNYRPSTQQIILESGSEILAVDNAEQRVVSGSIAQQSAAKIKEQVNVSRSSTLSGNIEQNSAIAGSNRQFGSNNTEDSKVSGLNIFAADNRTISGISLRQVSLQSGEKLNISKSIILAGDVQQLAKETDISEPIKLDVENRTMSTSNIQQIITNSELSLRQLAPNSDKKAYFSRASIITSESVGNGTISATSLAQLVTKNGENIKSPRSSIPDLENEHMNNSGSSTPQITAKSEEETNISGLSSIIPTENIENRTTSGSSVHKLSSKSNEQVNLEDGANSGSSISQLAPKNGDQPYFSNSSILTTESIGNCVKQLTVKSKEQIDMSRSNTLTKESIQNSTSTQLSSKIGSSILENSYNRAVSGTSIRQLASEIEEQINYSESKIFSTGSVTNRYISDSNMFVEENEKNDDTISRSIRCEQLNVCGSSILNMNSVVNKTISENSRQQLSVQSYDHKNYSGSSMLTAESVQDKRSSSGSSVKNVSIKSGEQLSSTKLTVESIKNESKSEQLNICGSSILDMNSVVNKTISENSRQQLSVRSYDHKNYSGSNMLTAESVQNKRSSSGSSIQNLSSKSGEQLSNTKSIVESTKNESRSEQLNICASSIPDINSVINITISENSRQQLSVQSYDHKNYSGSSIITAESVQDKRCSSGSSIQNLSVKSGEQLSSTKSTAESIKNESSIRKLTVKSEDQTNICGSSLTDISTQQFNVRNGDQTNISWSSILNKESGQNQTSSGSSIQNFCYKSEEQINSFRSSQVTVENTENSTLSRPSLQTLSPAENVENRKLSGPSIRGQKTDLSKSSIFTSESVENITISGSTMQQFVVKTGDQIIIPKLCVLHVESTENNTNSGVFIKLATKSAEPTTTSISSTEQRLSPQSSVQLSEKSLEDTNISNPSIQLAENINSMSSPGSNMDNVSNKDTVCQNIVYELISDNNLFHKCTYNEEIAEIIKNEDNIINEEESGSIEKKIIDQQMHYKETIHKLLSDEQNVNDRQDTITYNQLNKSNILFKGISTFEDKSLIDQRVIDEDDEEIFNKLSKEKDFGNDEISYNKLTEDGEQIPFLQASNSPSSTTTVEQMLMLNECTIDLLERNEELAANEKKSNRENAFDIPGEPVN
ncbi:unnamed protein product [Psylliodes chrysocephalus]|uniref:Doublecortin domain-containing protein n=1 Tax=Psylliodes chrysocephalus TaxID=3402493 RepID=A0A9P0GFF4_9CUCU|nr:unnamed protein product [Psylliodes chrysocephala]